MSSIEYFNDDLTNVPDVKTHYEIENYTGSSNDYEPVLKFVDPRHYYNYQRNDYGSVRKQYNNWY